MVILKVSVKGYEGCSGVLEVVCKVVEVVKKVREVVKKVATFV